MANDGMNNFSHDYGKKIFIANLKRFCPNGIDETVKLEAFLIELPDKSFVDIRWFDTYDDLCKIIECSKNEIPLDIFLGTSTDVDGGLYVDEETLLSYNAYVSKPQGMSNADFKRLIYGKNDHRKKQAK